MKSVTLLFPGQGAQYVGMGASLEAEYSSFFTKADEVLGFSLSTIIKDGPEDDLRLTKYTQPAIVSYSYALYKKLETLLEAKGVKVDRVLGHSVGEYSALAAAGSLSFEDAIKAVHLRGSYMQEAVPSGQGKMYAMMRTDAESVKKACDIVSVPGNEVQPANYNEPGQTVISGHAEACDKAVAWANENIEGRFRAIELKVSAPFHSSLMAPATQKLSQAFENITFNSPKIPYIANIDAAEYGSDTDSTKVKLNLLDQVCGSVLWSQSINKLPDDTICIEVGPGKVLAGLVKKINSLIKVISLDKDGAFEELEELLND
ncbi:MAG: ACP S-malonyltransferase [Bacteriovoracaceae bacterium]|nr:ACP S-malonyltransferase [Bacteriovoracaceae bacterium]